MFCRKGYLKMPKKKLDKTFLIMISKSEYFVSLISFLYRTCSLAIQSTILSLCCLLYCSFSQLPRLSGRWVPGIPRGFHCGQPAPRYKNCPHGWQIPATQPWAPIPGTRHTDQTVEGRKIGMGGGEDAKWTAPQTTAQTLDEQLADPSRVQSYHTPCEPAPVSYTHLTLPTSDLV